MEASMRSLASAQQLVTGTPDSETTAHGPETTPQLGPVQPPPDCASLLRFVGDCDNRGTAIYAGLVGPPGLCKQPFFVVVGMSKSVRWSEQSEVKVAIDNKVVTGEVVSFDDLYPWIGFVEPLEQLTIDGDGQHLTEERGEEVVLLRPGGVQIPGRLAPETYDFEPKPIGCFPGAKLGDVVVNWKGRTPRIHGVIIRVRRNGECFEMPIDVPTVGVMENQKGDWYFEKYPGRVYERNYSW